MILSCTPTSQSSITVVSPAGGEQWAMGSTQTIKWTSTGNIPQVTISLVSVGGDYVRTRSLSLGSVQNSGSYSWTIPNCGPGNECSSNFEIPAGTYYIQISGSGVNANSNQFSVVSGTTTSPVPTITSLAPTSATVGTQVTIIGTNFGSTDTVLMNGYVAASGVSSNGTSITFTVPQGFAPNCTPASTGAYAACPQYVLKTMSATYSVSVQTNGVTSNSVPLVVTANGGITNAVSLSIANVSPLQTSYQPGQPISFSLDGVQLRATRLRIATMDSMCRHILPPRAQLPTPLK